MKKRILSLLLAFCLIMPTFVRSVSATETFEYAIVPSATTPLIGGEFDVVISLTNYSSLVAEIRALQINVTVDTSVFEIVSHSTMINDDSAASDKTSFLSNKKQIRLVYAKMTGTMDKSISEVMKFRLKVKDDLVGDGSASLPITFKIGTLSENITLEDSLTINYKDAASSTVSVEVSWGSMEFVYNDGTWDKETHKWIDSGWKPLSEDSNLVTVKNTGDTSINIEIIYTPLDTYKELSGIFVDSSNNKINSLIYLEADGSEKQYWLKLLGTTANRWTEESATIGNVTLLIEE